MSDDPVSWLMIEPGWTVVSAQGEKIGKADAGFVREKTGYAIGGVAPVGHASKPVTFIDEDLLKLETIWAAAGTPFAVFRLVPDDLQRLTGGQVARIAQPRPAAETQ